MLTVHTVGGQASNGRGRLSSVTFHGGPAGGCTRAGQAMMLCRLQSNCSFTAGQSCYVQLGRHLVTGLSNQPVLSSPGSHADFCRLSSSSSVTLQACGPAGRWACRRLGGRHCMAGQCSYVPFGRHVLVNGFI